MPADAIDTVVDKRLIFVYRAQGWSDMTEFDIWDVELWAARSRQGEVCGILGCPNDPAVRCEHCSNMYCEEHRFVLSTPAHLLVRKSKCQLCDEGEVVVAEVKNFETTVAGIKMTLPVAVVGTCNRCGSVNYAFRVEKAQDDTNEVPA